MLKCILVFSSVQAEQKRLGDITNSSVCFKCRQNLDVHELNGKVKCNIIQLYFGTNPINVILTIIFKFGKSVYFSIH